MMSQLTSVLSPTSVESIRVVTLKMLISMVTTVVRPHGNIQLGQGFNNGAGRGETLVSMETYWVANHRWRVEICYDSVHTDFHLLLEVHFEEFWLDYKSDDLIGLEFEI